MHFGLGKPETVEDTMLLLQARYTFFSWKTGGGGLYIMDYFSVLYELMKIFSSLNSENKGGGGKLD